MSYSVTGSIGPHTYHVSWSPAGISGDEDAVRLIERRAAELDGALVGPPCGPYTDTKHLADPLSSFCLLEDVFDVITDALGDVPMVPEVPEGCIA